MVILDYKELIDTGADVNARNQDSNNAYNALRFTQ